MKFVVMGFVGVQNEAISTHEDADIPIFFLNGLLVWQNPLNYIQKDFYGLSTGFY
jgi:hypothetical protein